MNSSTYEGMTDEPPSEICPHSAKCPGCPLIEMPYRKQLETKRAALEGRLAPYAELREILLSPIVEAPTTTHYRPRLKWAHHAGDLGLFGRGTHEVVDTPRCVVGERVIVEVGAHCRTLLRDARFADVGTAVSAVDIRSLHSPSSGGGPVTEPTPTAVVTLVVSDRGLSIERIEAFGKALITREPRVTSFAASRRSPESPQLLGDTPRLLIERGGRLDRSGSVIVEALPGSFVQAHRQQASAIEELVVARAANLERELGRPLRVLELYAGSGALGLALATRGARVTAVESFAPAAEAIGRAAAALGTSIEARAEDAEVATRALAAEPGAIDLVVVDPPRRGLPPRLRETLARLAPRAVVYVSCQPATLARDLAHLARLGLRAASIVPIDMMPHTDQVEAVALLESSVAAAPRPLAERDGRFAFDKPPFENARTFEAAARRSSATLQGARSLWSLPSLASGLMVLAPPDDSRRGEPALELIALAKGVVHKRGALGPHASYRRERVVGGHSLVRVSCSTDLGAVVSAFARIGHPILGDEKTGDEATRRHFFEKHGLDRLFLAVVGAEVAGARFTAPLAPDLESALASLDAPATSPARDAKS